MYSAHGTAIPKFYMTPEILKEDNFIPECYQRRLGIQRSIQPLLQSNSSLPDCAMLLAQYRVGGIRIVVYILLVYLFQD